MIKKYRKIPVTIDAVQWTGDNEKEILEYGNGDIVKSGFEGDLMVVTLEGMMHISKGDFIIKGVRGEFYPCKPDIFWQTYEEVGE